MAQLFLLKLTLRHSYCTASLCHCWVLPHRRLNKYLLWFVVGSFYRELPYLNSISQSPIAPKINSGRPFSPAPYLCKENICADTPEPHSSPNLFSPLGLPQPCTTQLVTPTRDIIFHDSGGHMYEIYVSMWWRIWEVLPGWQTRAFLLYLHVTKRQVSLSSLPALIRPL